MRLAAEPLAVVVITDKHLTAHAAVFSKTLVADAISALSPLMTLPSSHFLLPFCLFQRFRQNEFMSAPWRGWFVEAITVDTLSIFIAAAVL